MDHGGGDGWIGKMVGLWESGWIMEVVMVGSGSGDGWIRKMVGWGRWLDGEDVWIMGIWLDHGGGDGWIGKMVGWGRWLDGEDGWMGNMGGSWRW